MDDIRHQLARELGCITEEEMAAVAQVELTTLRNWRSRQFGPPFVTLGNETLYPLTGSREWLEKNAETTLPANAAFEQRRGRRHKTAA